MCGTPFRTSGTCTRCPCGIMPFTRTLSARGRLLVSTVSPTTAPAAARLGPTAVMTKLVADVGRTAPSTKYSWPKAFEMTIATNHASASNGKTIEPTRPHVGAGAAEPFIVMQSARSGDARVPPIGHLRRPRIDGLFESEPRNQVGLLDEFGSREVLRKSLTSLRNHDEGEPRVNDVGYAFDDAHHRTNVRTKYRQKVRTERRDQHE